MMVFLSTMEWTLIDCSISCFHRRRFVFHTTEMTISRKIWPVIINPNMLQNLRSLTHDHRSFTSKFFLIAQVLVKQRISDLMVVLYIDLSPRNFTANILFFNLTTVYCPLLCNHSDTWTRCRLKYSLLSMMSLIYLFLFRFFFFWVIASRRREPHFSKGIFSVLLFHNFFSHVFSF